MNVYSTYYYYYEVTAEVTVDKAAGPDSRTIMPQSAYTTDYRQASRLKPLNTPKPMAMANMAAL